MEEEIEMLQDCSNNQQKRRKIDTESPSTTIPSSIHNSKKPRVSFVLDKAPLKMGTVHKTSKILNVDEHSQILLKQKKNLEDYNPAILHRSLLAIIDSPLTKSGMVQSIYVKVDNGVLFEVKPHTRIPRMYKRFYGLMVELLKKSRITSNNENEKLLHVIQEPVTKHLPPNSHIIGLSHGSENLVKIEDYVASINDDVNLVFVVGLMAHGEIDKTYIDDFISVSKYPLSSSVTIGGFVCDALQDLWNII